jgi:hypothetical protein
MKYLLMDVKKLNYQSINQNVLRIYEPPLTENKTSLLQLEIEKLVSEPSVII